MGLLSGLWNAVDPYLPDEQVMGLLGRLNPQPQGLLGGEAVRLGQPHPALRPTQQQAAPQASPEPIGKDIDGKVGFLSTLLGWDGKESWGAARERLQQEELSRPMTRQIQQNRLRAVSEAYGSDQLSPQQRLALGLNPEALGAAFAEGSKPRQSKIKDVNGFLIDENDPDNVGRFIPDLPEGAVPLYDENRNPVAMRLLDGTVAAIRQQKGAEEAARADYDIVELPLPNGQTVRLPRSIAVQALGGGASSPQPSAGPSTRPTLPQGLGLSQSPADAEYEKVTAKSASEQYQAIQQAGSAAGGNIAKYRQLGALFEGVEGNKLAPAGLELAKFANSMGLKVDPNLANTEAAVALANEMALELRNPAGGAGMPGALSDRDREFLLQMVPNLLQSNEGRKKMVEARVAIYEREQDVAGMARKWHQRFGRLDKADATGKTFHDYLGEWAAANPLFAQ